MTLTLILTLNIVLAVAILGGLAYVMAHPRKLEPHVSEAAAAPTQVTPEARVRRHARRTGKRAPARLQTALD